MGFFTNTLQKELHTSVFTMLPTIFFSFWWVRHFVLSIYLYSLSYYILLLENVSCDLSGVIGLLFLFYHLTFRSFLFFGNFCLFSKSLKSSHIATQIFCCIFCLYFSSGNFNVMLLIRFVTLTDTLTILFHP